jgi:tetratricopeptide (TPR) repeat protein
LDYAPKRAEVRFLFSKRYGEAIEFCDLMLELYEKNKKLRRRKEIKGKRVEILWILGVSYYMEGNYEKAIEYFDKGLAACEFLVRKKMVHFYVKAKALEKLGREEEAKKCFENAKGVEELAKENITVKRTIRLLNEE